MPPTLRTLATLLLVTALTAVEMGALSPTPQACPTLADPEFITLPQTRAHPGLRYDIRVCVKGGTWPYTFSLAEAPEGMAIDPARGVVTWTPAADASGVEAVAIVAVDAAGKRAEQRFELTVGSDGFFFVSPDGDDANPGTLAQPWQTVMRAAGGEGVADPASSVLYLRGGTYAVDTPPKEGRQNANTLVFTTRAPRRWVAYPDESPTIDFGWSREQWQAVLDKQKERGVKEPSTRGYGHRMVMRKGTDGACFDGLEVINTCYFAFVMWDGQANLHWRRCRMRDLYADYRENPAFIFTYAVGRKGGKTWGERPQADGYRNLVIQDCHFSDRHYWSPRGKHGGAFVFFTVRDAVVEDCLIERIERGQCFIDKDNGWGNTYRNNVLRGAVMFAAQGCNDEVDFHHNLVAGPLIVGKQPGWMRNMWVHHNTLLAEVNLMGGGTGVPVGLDQKDEVYKGPYDPDTMQAVAAWPQDRKTVHFYRNVVRGTGSDATVMRHVDNAGFAKKWRFVRWEDNVTNAAAQVQVLWQRTFHPFAELRPSGIGASDRFVPVELDDEGMPSGGADWADGYGIGAATAATGVE